MYTRGPTGADGHLTEPASAGPSKSMKLVMQPSELNGFSPLLQSSNRRLTQVRGVMEGEPQAPSPKPRAPSCADSRVETGESGRPRAEPSGEPSEGNGRGAPRIKVVSDRGHHDTELARLSATVKLPQPMAPHDRRRLLRLWALITPSDGVISGWLQTERVAGQSRVVRRQRAAKAQR